MPGPAISTSPTSRPRKARRSLRRWRDKNLSISALGYYPNPLHPDPAHRETVIDHLKKVIVAARRMGVAAGQHLLRRRCLAACRRQLGGGAQGLAGHHRPCPRQRRQAGLRELPDDLQLRRVAGRAQHRLLALRLAPHPGSLGRRCRHELRPVASGLADDRPGALHPRVRPAYAACACQGPDDRPRRPLRARHPVRRHRLAGSAHARASARSTGA